MNQEKHEVTFQTWNKVADLYREKFMDLDEYELGLDYFCDALKSMKADVLDIGCGPGNISKYLLNNNPKLNLLGIDYAPNMIKLAIQNNPNAKFKIMDARNISEIQSSFDGVVCGFCMPYLSEIETEKFIADSASLLKENGLLYLSFVEGIPEMSDYKIGSTGDKTFFNYHLETTVLKWLNSNQLVKEKSFDISYTTSGNEIETHKILICHKEANSQTN